jgi:hypothetical protein
MAHPSMSEERVARQGIISIVDRGAYIRFLIGAAENKFLDTTDINVATGGDKVVGCFPIRRASYLDCNGDLYDFWSFCVDCVSHALFLEGEGKSGHARLYLSLAGNFHGLLIGLDNLLPLMSLLCHHASKVCSAILERECTLSSEEYLHDTLYFMKKSTARPTFHYQ